MANSAKKWWQRVFATCRHETLARYFFPARKRPARRRRTPLQLEALEDRFVPSNLVVNGDFSAGNTGFTSGYTYSPGNLTPVTAYDVTSTPVADNGAWLSYGDPSGGNGMMMVVNGATSANVPVWSETVTVAPNQTYAVSAWMAQLYNDVPAFATLQFSINGTQVGSTLTNTSPATWNQFSSTWNSGTATQATLAIVDTQLASNGNDFTLDDIFFGQNGPTVTAVSSTTPAGTYAAGAVIPITVTLSAPVTVTGTPTLALNTTPGAVASYAGTPGSTLTTLVNFNSTTGNDPYAGLIMDSAGNLFGTTEGGGASSDGTVFEIAAGTHALSTLIAFNGTNGANPDSGLVMDSAGNLFGTTFFGGASDDGTVFEISAATHALTTLVSFNGTNGKCPEAGLIMDSAGNLFGTTYENFSSIDGTVFEVTAGTNVLSTLASFNGTNGSYPTGLFMDSAGNIFGTTVSGGASGDGTVFEIAAGTQALTTLVAFSGTNGKNPYASLIADSAGNLFGTTGNGGASGDGTAFEIAASTHALTTLVSFSSANANPYGGLIMDSAGNLFGTTANGGAAGDGTVFEISAGTQALTTLVAFNGTNSFDPTAGLLMDSAGNLFGTTYAGATGAGTVFEIPAASTATTTLTFNYTVAAGQTDPRLDYTSTSALTLSGGTIQDASGDNAVLTLPASGSDGLYNQDIVIGTGPTVTAVSPGSGSTFGGTSVVITGTDFTGATAVSFGGTAATSFMVNSATQVTAVAPPGTAGPVDITVTAPSGTSATSASDQFTYVVTAIPFGLYNTGVDDTGAPLAGGAIDPHYQLVSSVDTNNPGPSAYAAYYPAWMADSATSEWLSAEISTEAPTGDFDYQTTFNLTGYNPATVTLTGKVSCDNEVMDILLNGQDTGITDLVGFDSWIPFTITSGFQAGVNTLEFIAYNGVGPAGFRAELSATANLAVSALSFTTEPVSTTAGSTLNAVTVQAVNASGNGVPGLPVNLSISAGTLNGTLTATTDASGLAIFSGLSDTTPGSYALTATAASLTALSSSFTIAPAPLAALAFTTQPASTTAGTTMSVVSIQATDSFGNAIPGAAVSLSISSGTLNGTLTATTNASGLATFAGLSDTAAGTYTLTATSAGVTTLSSQFIIAPAAASKLTFTTEPPASITVNAAFPVAVQITDAYGNPVPGASVTLTPSWGVLNGVSTVSSDANGTASFSGLSMGTVGNSATLTAAAGTLTVQSTSFNVTPGTLTTLSFTVQPIGTTAGSTLTAVTVRATDSFGNVVSGASINVSIVGTLKGSTPLTTGAAGLAVFSDLSIDQTGTYTITATSGTVTANSQSFIVSPAAAATLAFTAVPVSTTAGATLATVSVSVTDKFGNPVPNVAVTLTPSAGTLTGTTSVTSNPTGTASFTTLSLKTVGTYTLTASATGLTSIVSGSFTISPALASKLTFVTQPRNVAAGAQQSVAVEALDSFGNPVAGVSISTLALSPAATLNGFTATNTAATGIATFGNLTVNTMGTYTMTAGGAGLNVTSTSFVVSATSAATIAFVNQPGTTTAGNVIGPVTAQALDSFGNPVANLTISMALTSGSFSSGTTAIATNAAGQAVFSNLVADTMGAYTLSMSASGLANVPSNAFTVTAAAPILAFKTQPIGTIAGNTLNAVTVHAVDRFGNLETGLTVNLTVAYASGSDVSGSGTLDGITSMATDVSGNATFSTLSVSAAGTCTLTASASGAANVLSSSFVIAPRPLATLTFTTQPPSTTAGSNLGPIIVQALDTAGGGVVGATVTLTVAYASGSGSLNGSLSALTDAAGNAVFSTLAEVMPGTYTLRATARSISTTSNSFAITAASASSLSFTTQPVNASSGVMMRAVTVRATDKFGNVVAGVGVTLTLSSGTLRGTTAGVTNASGQASFSNLSIMPAGTGYTLTAAASKVPGLRSNAFNILAMRASSLSFTTQPTYTTAGSNLGPVTLAVLDANGNAVSGTPVTISISSSGRLVGALSAVTDTSGNAVFSNLSENLVGTFTLRATCQGLSATSSSFTITAASAAKVTFVTQPTTAVAGNALKAVSVLATDRFGNIAAGAAVNIGLLSDFRSLEDFGSLSGGTLTLTTDASGRALFGDLVEDTAGTYTLIATAGSASAASRPFVVKAAAASQLTFLSPPNNGKAGTALSPFIVEALDSFGNVATTSPTAIRISDGTLSKGPYLTNALGQAVIANWIDTRAGTFTMTMSAAGVASVESNSYSIAPAAGLLSFLSQPSRTVAGNDIGPVTVRLADRYGNALAGVAVSIGITPGTVGGGAQTLTTDTTGQAVFDPLTENLAGTYSLVATAPEAASLRSRTFTVSAAAPATLTFTTPPQNITAGGNLGTVTAQFCDPYGNVVTTPGTIVTMSVSSGTLKGATTMATNAQGRAIFNSLSETTAGMYTLLAAGAGLTATSRTFVVSANVASRLTFMVQPASTTAAGNLGVVTVQVDDAFGNPIAGQTVTITGSTTLTGVKSALTDASGDAIFSNLSPSRTGTFTLTAYDGSKTATSSSFTIT